MLKGHEVFFSL